MTRGTFTIAVTFLAVRHRQNSQPSQSFHLASVKTHTA